MRHHTTSPSERAADIATREAEKVWEETHTDYEGTWLKVYYTALKEMAGDPGGLYETNSGKHINTCH